MHPFGAMPTLFSPEQSNLLFALLDAARDEGFLCGTPLEKRWLDARPHYAATSLEAQLFWSLLDAADRAGCLDGAGWIRHRWRTFKAHLDGASDFR